MKVITGRLSGRNACANENAAKRLEKFKKPLNGQVEKDITISRAIVDLPLIDIFMYTCTRMRLKALKNRRR